MNNKLNKLKLFFLIVFITGFIVNGVFITLYNVDKSVNIGSVTKEITNLKNENDRLVENISEKDSLTGFLNNSKILGYDTNVKILYLSQSESVAQAR